MLFIKICLAFIALGYVVLFALALGVVYTVIYGQSKIKGEN
jgi:uncharacterized membrane protein